MPRTPPPGTGPPSQAHQLGRHVRDPGAVGVRLDLGEGGGQHLVGVAAVSGDARDGQLSQLPAVALANLGGRDLKLGPDAAQESADDMALGLQRPALRQVHDDPGDADRDRGGHQRRFLTIGGTPHMMACELDAPLGVAGIQLEVGQMSGDADAEDKGFEQFERFLEHWSRRDFLKRTGGVAAYMAFAAGGLSFLEACGGGTPSTSLTPKKGGHVIEGNFSDIRTLNSMLSSDTASNQVIGLMFDGLLNYSKSGDLVPALAKSYTTSTDGLTYKFTLRDNLKFSDGQPLTADDVVFTYQLAYDPKYKDVSSPRRGDLQKYIASVTAPDPKTVVITTTTVFAPFLANHALYGILPKHVLGSMDPKAINTADFNTAPSVTNGPFKFVKWDKGQQVTMARNDNYST